MSLDALAWRLERYPMCSTTLSIPVSTVSLPGDRMGELAIELLLDEIRQDSSHVHRTVMLDPHLIPRRSTSGP
jgi:LacI family transcriptional regulator